MITFRDAVMRIARAGALFGDRVLRIRTAPSRRFERGQRLIGAIAVGTGRARNDKRTPASRIAPITPST